jgi:hypothetical protein
MSWKSSPTDTTRTEASQIVAKTSVYTLTDQGFFWAADSLSYPVRVVPSQNTPIRVHPSIILQPKKETLLLIQQLQRPVERKADELSVSAPAVWQRYCSKLHKTTAAVQPFSAVG